MRRLRVLLAPLLLSVCGCAAAGEAWVELAGERYVVEVADDDLERAQGLMFRNSMAAGSGMLFVHDEEEPLAYWMKNTRIALDILYFDGALRLVAQQRDVPPCSAGDGCPVYPSGAAARYVLELNAGEAAKLELQDGMTLALAPSIATGP